MIGQSFAPLGDKTRPQSGGPGGSGGPQEAIQVLNMRMPRFPGAGAPAPQALLQGAGSAGLPQQSINPVIQAILKAILGRFSPQQQAAPSAQGGMVPGGNLQPTGQPGGFESPGLQSPMPSFQMPTPALHYQEPSAPGGIPLPPQLSDRPRPSPADRGQTREYAGNPQEFAPLSFGRRSR